MTSKLEILKMIELGELSVEQGLEMIETLDQTEKIEADLMRDQKASYGKEQYRKDALTIEVSLVSSKLNVERSNVEEVVVELYDDSTRELIHQPEWLFIEENDNRITIRESRTSSITDLFDFFKGNKENMSPVYINLKLPYDAFVEMGKFSTVSGSVSAIGLKGNRVELSSVSGTVHAADIDANRVKLKSVSGQVIVDQIKSTEGSFTTTSGKLKITGSQVKANCSSVSGGVEYTGSDALETLALSNVSGKLMVKIPEPERYNLTLTSLSGKIDTSGFAVVDKSTPGKKNVSVNNRSENRLIKASTVSGAIWIDKL